MQNSNMKSKRRRLKGIVVLFTIPLQFIIAVCISCFLVFYGPFATVRKYVVETAMSTYSHQYLAKMFLSDAAINKILNENGSAKAAMQQITNVRVNSTPSRSIEQYEINGSHYHGYLLVVSDPSRVKVGYTKNLLKVGENTSDIAKDHNAAAAINGGGFSGGASWTGTGAFPTDFLFSGGNLVWRQPGLSDSAICNVVALDTQGKLIVGDHSIRDLEKLGVTDAVTLPGYQPLVVNGQGTYKGGVSYGMNPRTAIGQRQDGSILMLVLDGRRINMLGATLFDVQSIMLSKGAYTAAALDGGASATMYYNGSVINNPCGSLGERTVATAFYVEK